MIKQTVSAKILVWLGRMFERRKAVETAWSRQVNKLGFVGRQRGVHQKGGGQGGQGMLARVWQRRGRCIVAKGLSRNPEVTHFPGRVLVVVAAVFVAGFLFINGPFQDLLGGLQLFRVYQIEIRGCVVTSPQELKKYADLSYEMNLLSIDLGVLQGRLVAHPWVKQVHLKRVWPDRLLVSITEYRPQALVLEDGKSGFSYLGGQGMLFAPVAPGQELDYPVVTGLETDDAPVERRRQLQVVATVLKLAGKNKPNLPLQDLSEIHFTGAGELIVYLVERPFPIYFGRGAVEKKFRHLRRVLAVLYRKRRGKTIDGVAYIRVNYQKDKVLVGRSHAG